MKNFILLFAFLYSLTVYSQYQYNISIKVKEKKCITNSSQGNVRFKIYASNMFGDILYKINYIKASLLKEGETNFSFLERPQDFDTLLSPAKYILNIHDSTYQPPNKVNQSPHTGGIGSINIIEKSLRIETVYAGKFNVKDSCNYVVKVLIPETMLNSMFQVPQIQLLKPVIYFYSDQHISTNLSLGVKGNLTFSYPKYDNQWAVEVKDNQLFVEGKKYPYLFWEGTQATGLVIDKGSVVSKENLLSYLEESCSKLGLNNREKTDFITFWYPRLNGFETLKLQFLLTEEYAEKIADIHFSKSPNAMQRIYLLAQPCSPNTFLPRQSFEKVEREGFTVIEWGGSILPATQLQNKTEF